MKKINLLFTIYAFRFGGAEKFVLNLIRHLDHKKFRIVVFSDSVKDGPMREDFERVCDKIIFAQYHRYKHPFKFKKQLHQIIASEKIDIIHTNDDLNAIFPMLAKSQNTKIVVHVHSTNCLFSSIKLVNTILKNKVKKYISRHADCRLSCGELAGEIFFGKGNFEIIQNGIEIDKFKYSEATRNKLRKQYGIANDETVLMNIGRLEEVKNQTFLVEIFSEYQKLNPKSRLIIIGDGSKRKQIIQKVEDLKMGNKVVILSGINNVNDYYNMADAFVMPSLYEGMPVVSIEAQVNGLKCFFSDTITKEADHNGGSVFLSLSSTPKYWAKTIKKASANRDIAVNSRLTRYDISHTADKITDIYKRCKERLM